MAMTWKKGRGKLGPLTNLIGTWVAKAESEMGPVTCSRSFDYVLEKKYIQLTARWTFEKGMYEEICLFGPGPSGKLEFWSFTSDGEQSQGAAADVTDVNELAFGFEAGMPAGVARQAYWPDETEGFRWIVESKTKKGWRRFVEHQYKAA